MSAGSLTTTDSVGVTVQRLARSLGAQISGIDASGKLTDNEVALIKQALDDHEVVVLRDQKLTPQTQTAFAQTLGVPRVSFFKNSAVKGAEALTVVSNIVENGKPIGLMDAGALWHTDGSYLPRPDMYTVLYGIEIPQRDGQVLGDTCFASTTSAYDALADEEKRQLIGKRALHSLAHHMVKKREANFRPPPADTPNPEAAEVSHPVVRTHPRTGKACLYVTEGHTRAIEGLSDAESDEILRRLWRHIVQEKFIYRHKWRAGDLLIWDNCATQHLAISDYGDLPRRLHRSGITGEIPV